MQLYRLQDINLDDVDLKQQYYDKFLSGDIDGAIKIITDNPQLDTKVINAKTLNYLVYSLLEAQQEFVTNVPNKLEQNSSKFNLSIDELIYLTNFNTTIQYEINNMVMYNDNVYYCKAKPPIGTLPTNETYWLNLVLKGKQGNPSLGVNYKGGWFSTTQYVKYDMVVYQNKLYVAKVSNLNSTPNTDITNWLFVSTISKQGIYVVDTSGVFNVGDLYIDIDGFPYSNGKKIIFCGDRKDISIPFGSFLLLNQNITNLSSVNVYTSSTGSEPTNLGVGDIWLDMAGWVYGEKNSSIYIEKLPNTPNDSIVLEILE